MSYYRSIGDVLHLKETMPRPTDEERFISRLPEDGSGIGNRSLREWLGWEEEKYLRIRDRLIENGVIVRGPGQGGSVKRAPDEDEAPEPSGQTIGRGSGSRGRGRLSDEARFLSLMPEDGAIIRNKNLREQLGWDEDKYGRIKDRLIESGAIARARSWGGAVRLIEVEEEEFLAQVPVDGSDITTRKVMEALGWTDERFSRVHERLVEKGLIAVPPGRGKHQCIQRTTVEETAPEEVEPPVDDDDEAFDMSEQTSGNGADARNRGGLTAESRFLSLMPEDGTTVGNKNLREQLGWGEDKYWRIRDRLVMNGAIARGSGPGGGTVKRIEVEEEEFLAQVPEDGLDITNKKVMEALEWNEGRFSRVRERLLEKKVLVVPYGRGKHQCIQRAEVEKATPMPRSVTSTKVAVSAASESQKEGKSHGRVKLDQDQGQPEEQARATPKVFIGSSVEGLEIAEKIQHGLHFDAECTIWSQGVFGLSEGTLEGLVKASGRFDFAVLVLTPDDMVVTRNISKNSPRDNVLFELGLFMGALGRDHTFIVYCRDKKIELPTDLAGVTVAKFAMRSDGNLRAALGPVCTDIKDAIKEVWRGSSRHR